MADYHVEGRPKRGSHRIEAHYAVAMAAIGAQIDSTLVEIVALLLDHDGVTIKKAAPASEQDRPDVAARRCAWFKAQPDLDPERLVFIDETGASTKMARRHGRAMRGQRCAGSDAGPRYRMAIGKPPRSPEPCALRA